VLYYYLLVLNILCVTYYVTSIITPDPKCSGMNHIIMVNAVSAAFGISSPLQAVNSIPKPSYWWRFT